jgi:predicted ATP-dependent protease
LLLGSFGPQTKALLENVKEEIVKTFSGENQYALLLDSVEVYFSDVVEVLTELSNGNMITIIIFQNNQLVDMIDLKLEKEGADRTVYNYLRQQYKITQFNRWPVFDKLDILLQDAKAIFLVRDKEETRGGEYLELMHSLFRKHGGKLWFLKKDGVILSSMLMEYLDKYSVKMRTYQAESDLKRTVLRILQYQLQNSDTAN